MIGGVFGVFDGVLMIMNGNVIVFIICMDIVEIDISDL